MICIIPARGGSQRIPRKNIKDFRGRPMLAYAIDVATESKLFEHVFVSTNDHEIAKIAHTHGAGVLYRGPLLSEDNVGTQEVTAHALRELETLGYSSDHACCLYPCVPLLLPETLIQARRMLDQYNAAYVFTVGDVPCLHDAGQFYMGMTDAFLSNHPLIGPDSVMLRVPPERDCDINTPDDWGVALKKFDALRGLYVN